MDYLKIYEKFENVKEVADYINDVLKLRYYYVSQQYGLMWQHINRTAQKYAVETTVWNTVNTEPPKTDEQAYINAENFLQAKGASIIAENVPNYKNYLTDSEVAFVQSMITTPCNRTRHSSNRFQGK